MDIKISEVVTDLLITENVGSLSAEEVKRLVALVLEQVRQEQDRTEQRQSDTSIRDRAYRADQG